MGENRDATRAPGAAPAAEKKGPAADAGGGGAVPEGAAADPGSALTILAQSYGGQLLGVLQGAGGNAEVDAELTSLQEGLQVAAKAKADKDAASAMSDGQKVEKHGAKEKGEKKEDAAPAAEGAPPPGVADPGAAASFHATRGAELAGLAAQHATVAASLGAAAGAPGLAPELGAFLAEGATQSMAQQAALSALASTYAAVGAALAGSEFIGAALPGASVAAGYQSRIAAIQGVVTTLDTMCGEYDAALAAEQAKIAECDTRIAALIAQASEAAAAAKKAEEGNKGGDAKSAAPAPGAESKGPGSAPPGQEAKPAASKKGDAAKSAAGSTGNTGFPAPAAPEPAPAAAPAPTVDAAQAKSGGGGGGADAIAGITAQAEQEKVKKQGIESQISANQTLINAMKAFRDQMNALLAAYSAGSPPPAAAG